MFSTPTADRTSETRKQHGSVFYPSLDGFRAASFLLVFFHHYKELPWGWAGVDLFFVLSGFLITGILFDARNDSHRYHNFYIRRVLRIFPLYYGVILALLLTMPLFHWQVTWEWAVWPAYLGNFVRYFHAYPDFSPFQRLADFQPIGTLHGLHIPLALGHFWSLCVEEQFYLIWPCVVFSVRDRRKLIWICALSIPVCLALRIAGQHLLPSWMITNGVLNRATPIRLDSLLTGGLLALILRGSRGHSLLRIGRLALPGALCLAVICIVLIPHGRLFSTPYPYPSWTFTFGLTAIDILGGLLVLTAIQPTSAWHRLFNLAPLRWLGRISYSAYVLHDIPHPILKWLAERISMRFAADISASMALAFTLIASWLSFRYFESLFLRLKDRFTLR